MTAPCTTENSSNGTKLRAWLPLILWVLTTLMAGSVAYAAITNRLTALETRYDSIERDLAEIRVDVKELLRR